MDYVSTRNKERKVSAAYAIANGIAPDGGLYCPTAFPALTDADWKTLAESDYKGRSALILGKFLTDFTAEELADFASKAYADEKFGGADTAPVVKLGEGKNLLELWHGPTCAFKDMALQMLPHLLTASLRKTGETRTACILVATSGDTGKAALDGFHDVPGTKIMVYYPVDGVSPMQKLQMVTQEGGNVEVVAIHGHFDDSQSAVKRIFTDENTRAALDKDGPRQTPSTGAVWRRRSRTTFLRTAIWLPQAPLHRATRSTSAYRRATSATSLRRTSPRRWVCRSTSSSARPTATTC